MKKYLSIMLAAAMTATVVFAGCGSSSTAETEAPAETTAAETTAAGGDETEAPAATEAPATTEAAPTGAPAEDRPLRITCSSTPVCDPAVNASYVGYYAIVNIYDSLVMPSQTNPEVFEPHLAESWDISDDGLVYTFHLRNDATFHNGDPVKASDIVFSYNRMMTIGEGMGFLFEGIVKDVEAVDDATVAFTLNHEFGPFLSLCTRMYAMSEAMIKEHEVDGPYGEEGDYAKAWILENDAGSGPYTITEVMQQDHLTATMYNDYFIPFGEYAPTSFTYHVVTEPATVRVMMASNELDMTDEWQSVENLASMEQLDGVELCHYNMFGMQYLMFNTKKAPFDDVKVREAMTYLVDYDTVISNFYPESVKAHGPVNSSMPGANTDIPTGTYDIEKARQCIAESTYADTIGDYVIEFNINPDLTDIEKIALQLQSAAAEIGVTIEITKSPYSAQVDMCAAVETTPHISCFNEAPKYNDAGNALENRYSSTTAGTISQGEWLQSEEFDTMLKDAQAIVNDEERFAAYKEIQQWVVDNALSAYLCDVTTRVAYHADRIVWPAAEQYNNTGEINANALGFVYWFHDFEVH